MTLQTIQEIVGVLSRWVGPIVVAYSGGKDSSAVLKLVINALLRKPELAERVTVIYCDTKVENPILDGFVKRTLRALKAELGLLGLEVRIKILSPALHQRYFVRVVGRGYPPPTSFFRWCTKDLRIRPVQTFIRGFGERPLVLVGTRHGESAQRDRMIKKAGGNRAQGPLIQRQMDGGKQTFLYLPIATYGVEDVWECLAELVTPRSIDVHGLAQLYRQGGGECPMIRDSNDRPCASARFGCWVCTVVRRDKSAENLLKAGFQRLGPYYDFRTWLTRIRNEPQRRCKKRRNGRIGLGPFTLKTRRLLLREIRKLEEVVGHSLITPAEERVIRALWKQDEVSSAYRALEGKHVRRLEQSQRATRGGTAR
jgi:DNA sulfur modification protein DndC